VKRQSAGKKLESSAGDVDFICQGICQSLTIRGLLLTW